MDFTSAFKSEVFRPLVTLVVPGSTALGPYIIVTGYYIPRVRVFWEEHPWAFVAIVVVCILTCGLILEDIGTWVERQWDKLLESKNGDHIKTWYEYLKLELDDEIIGQRYLRIILTWMKFELAMAPALISLGVGLIWIHNLYDIWHGGRGVYLACIFLVCLTAFLLYESYMSATILGMVRKTIVEAAAARTPKDKNTIEIKIKPEGTS